jgi:para-aminobenzoate synthetase/4-amino-4-deoxychorismate lyase
MEWRNEFHSHWLTTVFVRKNLLSLLLRGIHYNMAESSTLSFQEFPENYYALFHNKEHVVFLESTQYNQSNAYSLLFLEPVQVLQIHRISELEGLFTSIATYLQQGYYLAGYFAYECGYHIKKLGLSDYHCTKQPLAWFGVYRQPLIYDHGIGAFQDIAGSTPPGTLPSLPQEHLTHRINDIAFNLDEAEYHAIIARIKEYIRAGDVYQINFMGRYFFSFSGSPLSLYQTLKRKQPVSYSAYIRAAGQNILSFSPELFFRRQGQHIITRPMKGTAPRGRTSQEDRQVAKWLASDPKNRAENVMILDLLRNDLGQICEIGSVAVPHLCTIEQYATLFTMTSTVEGRLKADIDYAQLFRSLFPCGSITGAPKIRAMEIIKELEPTPRGISTGSIGYFAPPQEQEGQVARAVFNVAIRTIVLENGHGEMGVGSGITFDSLASDEYAECAVKAQFLTGSPVEFDILEAVLWNGCYQHLEKHLQRMADSAAYFGYRYDAANIQRLLAQLSTTFVAGQRYKVRLSLKRTGHCSCEALQLQPQEPATALQVMLSSERTNSHNCMYYHKTTDRALYDRASRFAQEHGYADVIFLNEKGEVTEGATNNLFIERDGFLLTPPLCCGLLGGIYRQSLLEKNQRAREETLFLEDLLTAEKIYLCNAIRGLRSVKLGRLSFP